MESVGIPRRAIRLSVATQVIAATILLAAANYFSFSHYGRADFSRSQKFVLAEQTRRVFRELKRPVKVIVFFSPTFLSPETQLYPDVKNLLKEFLFSGRGKFDVEYVDPTRDLSRARELQGQYKFSADENLVILDYEGRTKFVPVSDMADFDFSAVETGEAPRLLAFKGELALTNALIALVSPERQKVCFLSGHGEPSVEGATSLSVFRDYIERQNVRATPLSLASLDVIPADCAVLVIIAPRTDIDEREAAILKRYFAGTGRLLVLLDPDVNTPRLRGLLEQAGIMPLNNRVLRIVRLPFATGILREVTAEFLPRNPITKRLAGSNILFSGATQSLQLAPSRDGGVQLWPLVRAADEFWGESEYVTDEKKGVRYDEGKDAGQPLYVAAAAARGGVSDERVEVELSKLIAVGNCEFALDAALNQQGLDFLLSAMNWLLDRGGLTGVMPKSSSQFSLQLTDRQLQKIASYTMVVFPGVTAAVGLFVWWRRRA